jgi:virginiamycin A acetyltransferase
VGLLCIIEKRFTSRQEIYAFFSQLFSLFPGIIGMYTTRSFYLYTLKEFHKSCVVRFGSVIANSGTEIENDVRIAPNCSIGLCSIGERTVISANAVIMSGRRQHAFTINGLDLHNAGYFKGIRIGRKSWIGAKSLIMANVGDHCIIGAGSVVVNDIEDYSVAVGNPARVIKKLEFGAPRPTDARRFVKPIAFTWSS